MTTSYNPTFTGLAEAIAVLTDILGQTLTVSRTAYGYHIASADGIPVTPPCNNMVDLYDEVLCRNIL